MIAALALVLAVANSIFAVGLAAYLWWDARAGWMDGEDTIRKLAREARSRTARRGKR